MTTYTAIAGATSPETAIVVDDYPYGFKLRTQIRYWIEYKSDKVGYRFASQTLNPKTGVWNKPKYSTYSPLAVLVRDDESGHISWLGWNFYNSEDGLDAFEAKYGAALPETATAFIEALHRGYDRARALGRLPAQGAA